MSLMVKECCFLKDIWLSECLGVQSFNLNSAGPIFFNGLPEGQPVFVTAKVSSDERELFFRLTEAGFRMVNEQVSFRKVLDISTAPPGNQIELPDAVSVEERSSLPDAKRFAGLFEFDRFSMDDALPAQWSEIIKMKWIRDAGQSKRFVVVFVRAEVAGFILFSKGAEYVIELVGVLDEFQGLGIATVMLSFLQKLAQNNNVTCLKVGTQKDNYKSMQLYRSFGFVDDGEKRVLHFSRGLELND